MIYLDLEQGSPEWIRARLGKPTASRFDKILTPKTLKPSATAAKLRYELLAEWILGAPVDDKWTGYTARGTSYERDARAWYEFEREVDVRAGGFCLTDDEEVGASPDGLIDASADGPGGLELKVPALHTHVSYFLDRDGFVDTYRGQCQGGIYVTGRGWWDLVSYSPAMPSVIVRVWPEPEYQAALGAALEPFCRQLAEDRATFRALDVRSAADRRTLDEDWLLAHGWSVES